MVKGLSDETEKIREIHRVLIANGSTPTEVNYHMNIDTDFISDVLQFYKQVMDEHNIVRREHGLEFFDIDWGK